MKRVISNLLKNLWNILSLKKRRAKLRQRAIEKDIPPRFSSTPKYPAITYHQRNLLFQLHRLTKDLAQFSGEFWWCVESKYKNGQGRDFSNLILAIKTTKTDGTFDIDRYNYETWNRKQIATTSGEYDVLAEWHTIFQKSHISLLEKLGYLTISPYHDVKENDDIREEWTMFSLTQQAFDYIHYQRKPIITKFPDYIWQRAENHLLSLIFGIFGAIIIEIMKSLFGS
jgi:hypothetical protein